MPPKAKFTKEQIVTAALELVRRDGIEGLTARTLAKALGSSSCPIFTVFEGMEEIRRAVLDAAKACYRGYVEQGLADIPAFKGVGTQYILFSMQEPKLFQLLFMSEREDAPDIGKILPLIEESYEKILGSITGGYGLDRGSAERLYRHLWIYTHGIATLCATGTCRFADEEISSMMTEVFVGLLKNGKGRDFGD